MPLNLYPYNYWILYAAIAAVVISLVLLAFAAVRALKAVQALSPRIDAVNQKAELAAVKLEAVNEKKAEDAKKNKWLMTAIPVLLAIRQIYEKDDTIEAGLKGYTKAAQKYITNRQEEKKLTAAVLKALGR